MTISEAAKGTGASRNTIKDHIKALTEKGHLARHGAGRGTWYSLGHSSIGITMDLYSHILPGMQEEAAERVDNALRAALNNGSQTT